MFREHYTNRHNKRNESERNMKYLIITIFCLVLAGCGTVGGAIQGFGSDLDLVGGYITDF